MKNTFSTCLFILFHFSFFAQTTSNLGRATPFQIGLKGTIYKYDAPKRFKTLKEWRYKPEIEESTPIGYVYTQSLNISERLLEEPFPGVPKDIRSFAIIYKGAFEVPEEGLYIFALKSDDGSILWVDGKEVVNHDGIHQFHEARANRIHLSKGFHTMKVWYFQGIPNRMGLLLLMKNVKDTLPARPFDLSEYEKQFSSSIQLSETSKGLMTQMSDKILFDFNKYDIKSEAENWLTQIARYLFFNAQSKVTILGHTDNVGSADFNLKLSENRAKAVMEALRKLNVPETVQFEVKGMGKSSPIAPNDTEHNRALNRRVEIMFERGDNQ